MDKRHVTACTLDCLHKSQLLNTTTFGGGGGTSIQNRVPVIRIGIWIILVNPKNYIINKEVPPPCPTHHTPFCMEVPPPCPISSYPFLYRSATSFAPEPLTLTLSSRSHYTCWRVNSSNPALIQLNYVFHISGQFCSEWSPFLRRSDLYFTHALKQHIIKYVHVGPASWLSFAAQQVRISEIKPNLCQNGQNVWFLTWLHVTDKVDWGRGVGVNLWCQNIPSP